MDTDFAGLDGFLGTRASLMMDLLVLAMPVVLGVLAWSIYLVRYRRRYGVHRWVQISLTVALAVVVAFFEVDIRTHGWQDRAAGAIGGDVSTAVWVTLWVHVVIAVATLVLLPVVVIRALRGFGSPPRPGHHSTSHRFWGRAAVIGLVLTTVSSWVFYLSAFV